MAFDLKKKMIFKKSLVGRELLGQVLTGLLLKLIGQLGEEFVLILFAHHPNLATGAAAKAGLGFGGVDRGWVVFKGKFGTGRQIAFGPNEKGGHLGGCLAKSGDNPLLFFFGALGGNGDVLVESKGKVLRTDELGAGFKGFGQVGFVVDDNLAAGGIADEFFAASRNRGRVL